jgi:hypothetical protein
LFTFLHHYYSPQRNPISAATRTRCMMCSTHHCRHSHSLILDTVAATVTLPLWLPGSVLIVVLAVVDHWHRSSFISHFSCVVVVLSAGALVPVLYHVRFVQLIVMLSAEASSSASHHTPCLLMPSPPVCLLFNRDWLLCCPCCCATASSCSLVRLPPPRDAPPHLVHFSSRLPLDCWLVVMLHLVVPPPPPATFRHAATLRVHP